MYESEICRICSSTYPRQFCNGELASRIVQLRFRQSRTRTYKSKADNAEVSESLNSPRRSAFMWLVLQGKGVMDTFWISAGFKQTSAVT